MNARSQDLSRWLQRRSEFWELLCDTSRYAEWVDGTLEVVRTDGSAQLDSNYDERPNRRRWKASTH